MKEIVDIMGFYTGNSHRHSLFWVNILKMSIDWLIVGHHHQRH